jgi:hypothetical protein
VRFAARHFIDPVIHVTRDPDENAVTVWVDCAKDATQWAGLTLTRSDFDGLAKMFGVEVDDPAQGLEPTTVLGEAAATTSETVDDATADIVLGE